MTSNQTIIALENERRYVARELHDGVAQTTQQLSLQVGICRKLLERNQQDMLTDELAQLQQRIQSASTQIRQMIADMRPPKVLPEATLDEYLLHTVEVHRERGGPTIRYQFDVSDSSLALSSLQAITLTRIVQEGLLNVRKHAQAKQTRLIVSADETHLTITISDNGQGFNLEEVEVRPTDKGGAGLANLRARAEVIGGTVKIVTNPNEGTTIIITLPK